MQRVKCPCCGYPTLEKRARFEICILCDWEDDGQDEPYSDEVWEGPNGDYSLTEARMNFKKHFIMYRDFQQTKEEMEEKNSLMILFDKLSEYEQSSSEYSILIEQIEDIEQTIYKRVADKYKSD